MEQDGGGGVDVWLLRSGPALWELSLRGVAVRLLRSGPALWELSLRPHGTQRAPRGALPMKDASEPGKHNCTPCFYSRNGNIHLSGITEGQYTEFGGKLTCKLIL